MAAAASAHPWFQPAAEGQPGARNTSLRLLGEKGEGERILYAEALFDESRALNLLGSYQLDTVIGSDFFEDPVSMHRDLLADGAAVHLKKMKFDLAK